MPSIATLLSLAQAASDAGDHPTAAAHCLTLHEMVPDDIGMLVNYAHEAANFDRPAVVSVIDRYLARHRGDARKTAIAIEIQLPYLEGLAREVAGLNAYSALDVDEPEFRFSGGASLFYQAKCEEWGDDLPMARAAFLARDYERCDRHLDRAGRGRVDPRTGCARFTGEWFDDLDDALEKFKAILRPVTWAPELHNERRIFYACDVGFFSKYGMKLEKSAAEHNNPVHRHMYDIESHAEVLRPGTTPQSVEREAIRGLPRAKHYYAAVRLIRMLELMERAPAPTIFIDADLFVGKSLNALFDRMETADVALTRMPGRLPFHTQFNASCVGIMPGGIPYLRRVAGFIAKCFLEKNVPWCLDQISLLCTLRNMQIAGTAPKVIATGPEIYDGSYDAALWPQKVTPHDANYPRWQAANRRFGT